MDGSKPKINSRSPTKYKPIEMTDDSVYDMATMYYTAEQIAERFNVTKETVLSLHGEAFHAGKDNESQKPRILLKKLFDDFLEVDVVTGFQLHFANKDVPVERLLKGIELHGKKYEGLGSQQQLEITQNPATAMSTEDIEKMIEAMGYVKK